MCTKRPNPSSLTLYMSNSLPFVFFGSPTVASETLEILAAGGIVPRAVVTNPDAPAGRGSVVTPTPVKVWAMARGIPVLSPQKITPDVVAEIANLGCAYGICVAYGKILSESLIDAFPKGILNVHYSLLPLYRGASPMEAALRAGDSVTGVTIQQMATALDTGDILAQKTIEIAADDTAQTLRPKLIASGARLLIETLPAFEAGTVSPTPQDDSAATYCHKFSKADGLLSLFDSADELWNTYRAYNDTIGTYTFFTRGEKKIRVGITSAHREADGAFVPDTVTPEGKREMLYADFLRSGAKPVAK